MATTGEKFPTSGITASESPWLDNDWTSPGSVTADDGTYASVTASTFDNGDQTFVLKAKGFDFSSIPAGATIDGIIVRIQAHADSTSVGIDLVQLLDTAGAKVGTNQSDTSQRITTSDAVYTFGSSTDLWGNALTDAWLKDADFGVAVGGHAYTANSQIFIDYVTVEVFYTVVTPKQTSVARMSLASGGTPTTQDNHSIHVRARVTTGPGSSTIKAALYEGANNRSGDLESSGLTTSLAEYTLPIADANAANITDYSNLEIRLWGYNADGTARAFEVDQVWLEIPAAATGAFELDASPGSYALTGAASKPVAGRMVGASPGSYALTGDSAGVLAGRVLAASPGSYVLTGLAALALAARLLEASPGSYAVVGVAADLIQAALAAYNLAADPGTYAITGDPLSALAGRVLAASPGAYASSGADAGLLADRLVLAQPGSYALSGVSAGLPAGRAISASPGSYALSGAAAGLLVERLIPALPGSYTITGDDAALLSAVGGTASDDFNRADSSTLGANWTSHGSDMPQVIGNQAGSKSGSSISGAYWTADTFGGDQFSEVVIPAIPASACWVGVTVREIGTSGYLLIAFNNAGTLEMRIYREDAGSYTQLQGNNVSFAPGDVMRLEVLGTTLTAKLNGVSVMTPPTDSTYASGAPGIQFFSNTVPQVVDDWSGGELGVAVAFTLDALPGSYVLSGATVALLADRVLRVSPGSYVLTGTQAGLLANRVLGVSPGAYALSGVAAGLLASRVLGAPPGSYALTGRATGLLAGRLLSADPGEYDLTGVSTSLDWSGATAVPSRLRMLIGVGR